MIMLDITAVTEKLAIPSAHLNLRILGTGKLKFYIGNDFLATT